jgi:hypothetical protein
VKLKYPVAIYKLHMLIEKKAQRRCKNTLLMHVQTHVEAAGRALAGAAIQLETHTQQHQYMCASMSTAAQNAAACKLHVCTLVCSYVYTMVEWLANA